ncbi:MAG: hypothetical protein EOP53_09950 [Sphingobacteriales bacterium]|nr:MAG: hypothetical protein EOP53_09950 [Sphingobacteriales bacterium]
MENEENTKANEASSQIIEEEKAVHNKFENLAALSISLCMLLALSLGLLFYYQFYEGSGNWRFTLKHKANDTAFMASLTPQLQHLQAINDSLKKQKPDTVKIIQTVEIPAKVEETIPLNASNIYMPDPDKKYLVQIGAFKNFDLSRFQPGMENMEQLKVNGLNTITVGRFSTQKEAELFAKDIKTLGISSPIVAKLEGNNLVAVDKPVVTKSASIKKSTAKKSTAKKPVAKKSTSKKPTSAKKPVAKKPVKKKTTR